jgi:large subunit ribosomal protein L32
MAVPKRRMSRSNTRSRRSQWRAQMPQVQKKIVNGRVTWVVPHRASVVTDSQGTPLFTEYNNRRVADA